MPRAPRNPQEREEKSKGVRRLWRCFAALTYSDANRMIIRPDEPRWTTPQVAERKALLAQQFSRLNSFPGIGQV